MRIDEASSRGCGPGAPPPPRRDGHARPGGGDEQPEEHRLGRQPPSTVFTRDGDGTPPDPLLHGAHVGRRRPAHPAASIALNVIAPSVASDSRRAPVHAASIAGGTNEIQRSII